MGDAGFSTADLSEALVRRFLEHLVAAYYRKLGYTLLNASERGGGGARVARVRRTVVAAVNMAVAHRRPAAGVIHHSDHGSQYTSLVFGRRLQEAGIVGSMGTVGDALDNAVAASFFATLQTELLDRRQWHTRRSFRSPIFEYIEAFYNRRRRYSTLGYFSPAEFEGQWRAATTEAAAD